MHGKTIPNRQNQIVSSPPEIDLSVDHKSVCVDQNRFEKLFTNRFRPPMCSFSNTTCGNYDIMLKHRHSRLPSQSYHRCDPQNDSGDPQNEVGNPVYAIFPGILITILSTIRGSDRYYRICGDSIVFAMIVVHRRSSACMARNRKDLLRPLVARGRFATLLRLRGIPVLAISS